MSLLRLVSPSSRSMGRLRFGAEARRSGGASEEWKNIPIDAQRTSAETINASVRLFTARTARRPRVADVPCPGHDRTRGARGSFGFAPLLAQGRGLDRYRSRTFFVIVLALPNES